MVINGVPFEAEAICTNRTPVRFNSAAAIRVAMLRRYPSQASRNLMKRIRYPIRRIVRLGGKGAGHFGRFSET